MEIELIEETDNLTNSSLFNRYDFELHDYYYELRVFYELPIYLIGAACNIIIALMILGNKSMRTRVNNVLLAWCCCDLGFILFSPMQLKEYVQQLQDTSLESTGSCILQVGDSIFHFFHMFVIVAFMSNYLMQVTEIRIYRTLICALVLVVFCIFLGYVIECYTDPYHYSNVLLEIIIILPVVIMITLIMKELYYLYLLCRKRLRLTADEWFRLNIVRIYAYVWTICVLTIAFIHPLQVSPHVYHFAYLIFSTRFLASMYILIYVVLTDRRFKICFLNLMTCQSERSDVDATIFLAEHENHIDGEDSCSIDIQINNKSN